MASPEINERGEVSLEGHLIGTIEGFRFTLAPSQGEADAKGLGAAAAQVVAPQIKARADRLAGAPNEELLLATDGYVRWKGEIVATLAEGDTLYAPRLTILADESLDGPDLERVQERLNLWLRHLINTQLEAVLSLQAPVDVEGSARGLAFRLYENLGLLPRQAVADEVKGLDQDVRGKLRKLGVKFGAYHIYVPASLKPAPRELALILFALKNGGVRQPGVTELPQIVLSGRTSFEIDPAVNRRLYEVAGFKVAGKRAVRVDILERLADIIRPLIALDPRTHQGELPAGAAEANGFRVTVEMTSLLGCSGEDFASILTSLGYRVRRVPKVAAAAAPATPAPDAAEATVDASAVAAVEGSEPQAAAEPDGAVPAEAPAIEAAAADLGAPAPDAATGEKAVPEPEYDEIWAPAGRRPENKRHTARREATPANGEARPSRRERFERRTPRAVTAEPKAEAPAANGNDAKPPQQQHQRADKPHRPERKPEAPRNDRPVRDKRPVVVDPDSPWAALAVLRNPKS